MPSSGKHQGVPQAGVGGHVGKVEEWQIGARTRPENVVQGEKTGSSCFLPQQLERWEGRASLSQTCQAVRGGQTDLA